MISSAANDLPIATAIFFPSSVFTTSATNANDKLNAHARSYINIVSAPLSLKS